MLYGRLSKRVMLILFLLAVWLPLGIMVLTPAESISEIEKRKLTPFPEVKLRKVIDFPNSFEAYYNDHFGLRRPLIRWYNYLRVVGLGVSDSKWVLIGKDGWLFQNAPVHLRDMRNAWPFSPGELHHWAKMLSLKQAWLKKQGIHYLFVFAPSKHLIYPEKLPLSVNRVSPLSRLDQLVDYLKQHTKVNFLDLRPVMLEAKPHLRPYHKTDTHWNDYGAFLAYRTVMEHLQKELPNIPILPLAPDDFMRVKRPGGDLAQTLDLKESLTEIEIVPREKVVRCGKNTDNKSLTIAEKNQQEFATRCATGKYRALLFRDSYSVTMMPYLSESFEYIYYHPASPVPLKGLKHLVPRVKPDVVIELRASRWLRTPEG
jgi:hypothetical protein